jgi:hypothetical protein
MYYVWWLVLLLILLLIFRDKISIFRVCEIAWDFVRLRSNWELYVFNMIIYVIRKVSKCVEWKSVCFLSGQYEYEGIEHHCHIFLFQSLNKDWELWIYISCVHICQIMCVIVQRNVGEHDCKDPTGCQIPTLQN